MRDNFPFSIFHLPLISHFPNSKLRNRQSDNKWTMANGQWTILGFTLIELLVVVSIIGILVSLLLASFTIVQQQARNTQRKNDLKQYQTALENYAAAKNSLYPKNTAASGVPASSTLCVYLTGFIATPCPSDPRGTFDVTYVYKYQSDGTGAGGDATATKWVLWDLLEGTTNHWVVCSTGASGEKALTSVSGGTCPL